MSSTGHIQLWRVIVTILATGYNNRFCKLLAASIKSCLPTRLSDAHRGGCTGLWPATVTDPVHGWYRRRDGGVGRYSVWHPPLRGRLQPMAVRVARSQPFEDLGLVPLGQEAIAAAVVPTTTFDVHTPPRRC